MKRRHLGISLFCWLALVGLACTAPGEDAPRKARMLMLTQSAGYQHSSVKRDKAALSPAEVAMTQLGQQSGLFTVDCTQDAAADFTKENLQKYDIVFFYTTGDLPIKPADLDYFFNVWLKQKGHGFIGAHSATDTFHNYYPYWEMIGGTFAGHPWGSKSTVAVNVHDTQHPASRPFGTGFKIQDEIYQYKNWVPANVHVLMSLDMANCTPKTPYQVPLAWVKEYGEGKIFYTNLGHNPETWINKDFLKSMEGAIRWIRGLEEGDATPNPDVSLAEDEKARNDVKPPGK